MRRQVILLFSIFATANCFDYGQATTDLLSRFNTMLGTPLYRDFGKLSRFKEEISAFSQQLVPLAEHYAKSLNEGISSNTPIANLTSKILWRISYSTHRQSAYMIYSPYQYSMEYYHANVSRPLEAILETLKSLSKGSGKKEDFVAICTKSIDNVNEVMSRLFGRRCMNENFSTRAASIIYRIMDSVKYENYSLIWQRENLEESQEKFNMLFAELYHFLARKFYIEMDNFNIQMFLRVKRDFVYKNKVKLVEDLLELFDIRVNNTKLSDCLPLTAFVHHHFINVVWPTIGDIIIGHIYASKFVTQMCANISHYGDPEAAERFVASTERQLGNVYTVVSEWFKSTMKSTWPTTETELIRGFMKEATQARHVPESSDEYKKIADFVLEKMKYVGDRRYNRHYLITKEYTYTLDYSFSGYQDFDMKCRNENCSHAASGGVQCVTLRVPKTITEAVVESFVNSTEMVRPKLLQSMKKEFYDTNPYNIYSYGEEPKGAEFYSKKDLSRNWFFTHYIGFHTNRYRRNCEILYGFKSEEGEQPASFQMIRYHNDGNLFSNCQEWLIFLGI